VLGRASIGLAIALGLVVLFGSAPALRGSAGDPAAPVPAQATSQRLDYELAKTSSGVNVHLFRIPLDDFELRILSPGEGRRSATVSEMTADAGALLGVNGSFFLDDYSPLGLLISQGKELQGLRKVDWGVFFVKAGRAGLVHMRDFPGSAGLDFAIESGPRLVVDGELIKVKPQRARRSMLGIDGEGRVLIAVTATSVLLPEAAAFMRDHGARYALNLDGGPSSQLSVPERGLRVESFSRVANGIGVFPRRRSSADVPVPATSAVPPPIAPKR
jgi:hypothetical protein